MGLEFEKSEFSEEDVAEFQRRLREETKLLKRYFDQREFTYDADGVIGLEIEAWLTDKNHLPLPKNSEFLDKADHPLLVHELSKFNFELNVDPLKLNTNCLSKMREQIESVWSHCKSTAKDIDANALMVGILPMVRDEMLQLPYMSDSERYRTLNRQLLKLRNGKDIRINIEGREKINFSVEHLMLEAAATSIQVHLQMNPENAKRVFNASMIASAPVVAISANSPFLYGNSLWEETRIPVFEQAVSVPSFRNKKGKDVERVTFGTGYVRHSLLELFLENLDGYPPLIPLTFNDKDEELSHLKFHNGTIWRWNRPIVGTSSKGAPHLRIEHRSMAAGPSLEDTMANIAFYAGLTSYFSKLEKAPEESMTFTDCTNNFYESAKSGLSANVRWFGKDINMQTLIMDHLLPKAVEGLERLNINQDEIDHYLKDVLYHRALSGQNGSQWQRSFIDCHGKDFQALTQRYLELQDRGEPVHKWTI